MISRIEHHPAGAVDDHVLICLNRHISGLKIFEENVTVNAVVIESYASH